MRAKLDSSRFAQRNEHSSQSSSCSSSRLPSDSCDNGEHSSDHPVARWTRRLRLLRTPEGYSCNVSGATYHKGHVGDTDYQSVFVTSMAFGAPLFFFAFCVALYLRESSSFVFATNWAELLRGWGAEG